MKNIKIGVVMIFTLLLSVGLYAQHGRGRNNYRYNSYYGNSRGYVSVNIGPRYHYPSYYNYRPAPFYRPIMRPVYRSPRPYIPYGPSFGFRLNVLPFGYNRIYVGSDPYYYNEGVYYRPYNSGGYEVVEPPLNATVNKLPSNATVTVVDGQKYYQVGGTFYQEEISENNKLSYRVVGTDGVLNTGDESQDDNGNLNATDEAVPALGSRYDELPADAKVQVINQQKYFVSTAGIYYKEVIEGDKVRYEVTTVD